MYIWKRFLSYILYSVIQFLKNEETQYTCIIFPYSFPFQFLCLTILCGLFNAKDTHTVLP